MGRLEFQSPQTRNQWGTEEKKPEVISEPSHQIISPGEKIKRQMEKNKLWRFNTWTISRQPLKQSGYITTGQILNWTMPAL